MSKLATVKKTKLKTPPRLLFYAPEGIGKSTLAAGAPNPIFCDVEGGSGQLEVARYPYRDGTTGHVPESFEEFNAGLDDLLSGPHDYQTVVVDTADALEKLVHKFVVKRDGVKPNKDEKTPGIHSYGYGKGFDVAVDEFRGVCHKLDRLRHERAMTVILLAHSQVKAYKSPTMESYDRFTMRMNEKAASFLREWCDVVGFCCYEETTTNLFDDERTRGVSTGRRLIKFERTAVHDAKSRYALPSQIEMTLTDPWAQFAKALSDAQDLTSEQLCEAIMAEAVRIGGDVTLERAKKNTETYKSDVATLQRVLEKMRETIKETK